MPKFNTSDESFTRLDKRFFTSLTTDTQKSYNS